MIGRVGLRLPFVMLVLGLASLAGCRLGAGDARQAEVTSHPLHLGLFVTADVRGETEPCG